MILALATSPFQGSFYGVKIGDQKEEVEKLLRFRMSSSGRDKFRIYIPFGKAELIFDHKKVTVIAVIKKYW